MNFDEIFLSWRVHLLTNIRCLSHVLTITSSMQCLFINIDIQLVNQLPLVNKSCNHLFQTLVNIFLIFFAFKLNLPQLIEHHLARITLSSGSRVLFLNSESHHPCLEVLHSSTGTYALQNFKRYC